MTSLHFPYMFWAHNEMVAPSWSLSLSGMPSPPADLLAKLAAATLADAGGAPSDEVIANFAHPCDDAQPRLEAVIAQRYGVPPERVIITAGASSAMHHIASRWFTPGTQVALDMPSYPPFRILADQFGATKVQVQRRESEGWQLNPADITAALAPGTAHIFVTNPNNPTGAMFGAETLDALHNITSPTGGVLVVSETYMEMPPKSKQTCAAAMLPRAISIGTMTKVYGFGAIRIGWIILGEELAAERTSLMDHTYLSYVDPPTPALRLGLAGMQMTETLIQPYLDFASECRPLLHAAIEASPYLSGLCPDSVLVAFPRVAPRPGRDVNGVADTQALAVFLAETQDLSVTPGDFFGAPGCIRLGFGTPKAHLTEALKRLLAGLEEWHAV